MKRRFITEKDKQKMRDLEEAGKSRKEITDEMDVDPATVCVTGPDCVAASNPK